MGLGKTVQRQTALHFSSHQSACRGQGEQGWRMCWNHEENHAMLTLIIPGQGDDNQISLPQSYPTLFPALFFGIQLLSPAHKRVVGSKAPPPGEREYLHKLLAILQGSHFFLGNSFFAHFSVGFLGFLKFNLNEVFYIAS